MAQWRAGRSTGRTLWRDEQLVGLADTAEVAAEIVAALDTLTGRPLAAAIVRVRAVLTVIEADAEAYEARHNPKCECLWIEATQETVAKIREALGPVDAQRRSEATPQKDLQEDPYALACLCRGDHHRNCPAFQDPQ